MTKYVYVSPLLSLSQACATHDYQNEGVYGKRHHRFWLFIQFQTVQKMEKTDGNRRQLVLCGIHHNDPNANLANVQIRPRFDEEMMNG